jgi:DNA processing protein
LYRDLQKRRREFGYCRSWKPLWERCFYLPGRISDSQSKGCLNLIRKDKALMITSAADLVYWMGWKSKITPQNTQKELFLSLTEEEEVIFNLLENKNSLDNILFRAKLLISKVAVLLFQLEMKGCVRSLLGNITNAFRSLY